MQNKPDSITRHLSETIAIAAPIAVAQLGQMAMALTDTLMLGRIGENALAAGGLGASFFFTCLFCLQGVVSGVAVLAARARGAGQAGEVPAAYWSGLAIATALSVPYFWLMSAPGYLLRLAGEPAALADDIAAYLHVLRWGVPAGLLGIGIVRAFLPAVGLQRLMLWVIPAGIVVNALLNVLLIYGGLGLPAFGMRGSAAATAITLWLTAAALVVMLHGARHGHHVRLTAPRRRMVAELLTIGVPVGLTVLVEAALFMVTGLLIGVLGPVPLAAHQVAIMTASVTFTVPLAVSQAANVRVAHAIGAGEAAAARRGGFVAMGLSAAFMLGAAAAMEIVPRAIAGLYLAAASPALPAAAALLRVAGGFQVVDGVQVTAAGALRGLKDTRVPMVLAAVGYWGIGFWLGRYLCFDAGLGALGLWWGLFAGLAAAALSLSARFAVLSRRR